MQRGAAAAAATAEKREISVGGGHRINKEDDEKKKTGIFLLLNEERKKRDRIWEEKRFKKQNTVSIDLRRGIQTIFFLFSSLLHRGTQLNERKKRGGQKGRKERVSSRIELFFPQLFSFIFCFFSQLGVCVCVWCEEERRRGVSNSLDGYVVAVPSAVLLRIV